MSQAFLISTIENGSVSEWNITNPKEFFDKYLSPYIKYVKKPNGAKPGMVIYTNNKTLYVNPQK